MNVGNYVFSQVIEFLCSDQYNKGGKRPKGNFKVKSFSCWHHMLCMFSCQMSKPESSIDLAIILQTQQLKWYQLGIGTTISKSNLFKANENGDWRIYAEYACIIIAKERQMRAGQK